MWRTTGVRSIVAAGLLAVGGISSAAQGQNLPSQITILVAFAPGGPVDAAARQLGEGLHEKTGVTVVIENKPGANGVVAANILRESPADGSVLQVTGNGLMTISPHFTKMAFDPLKDLTSISGLVYTDSVVVVNAKLPVTTLKDFVEYAKKSATPLTMGTGGNGNITHLYMERLKEVGKVNLQPVPYKGAAPAVTDTAGGHVDGTIVGLVTALPLIQAGQVKALAIVGDKRSPLLPSVPTSVEAGYPIMEIGWFALIGPPNMSEPLKKTLADLSTQIINEKGTSEKLAKMGLFPWTKTPAEFAQIMESDSKVWKKLIEDNKITSD